MALRGMPSYSVDSGFCAITMPPSPLTARTPQRAVAAGAREHDADRPLVLVLGQGAEEEVNRQAQAARRGRFQQLQRAVQKGHVPVGRNDVGAVGLDRHPVLDLEDLHAGVALDQVGQDALVVRGQVLHQDKGHAADRYRRACRRRRPRTPPAPRPRRRCRRWESPPSGGRPSLPLPLARPPRGLNRCAPLCQLQATGALASRWVSPSSWSP